MNSKLKFVIILSLLVLAIAAGVYAYNRLSAQYAAPAAPVASSSRPATQSAASDTDRTAAPDLTPWILRETKYN
jgi:flagellar basal body-associated protein FliL